MIRLAGLFNPLPRELNETLYQFEQPFICDASKFQRALGPLQPTPHADAVQRTVEWFRRRYPACETNPRCAPRRPQGVVGDLLRDCAHRGDPNHTRALSRILPAAGLGSKSHRGGCHLCHIDCAGSNPGRTTLPHVEGQRRERGRRPRRGCGVLQETGARRQQIEQQSHAGPFVGPKPKSMMVPRGARRSDQKAHPSRLEQARRFLPSWPCEFDSRHPLQIIAPSQGTSNVAALFEHADDENGQAGHAYFLIIGARSTEVPCQA
jgi:hypothetical protein